MKNPAVYSSRQALYEQENLLIMAPPKHPQIRNLVNQALTPKAIPALETSIKDIAGELLDAAIDGEKLNDATCLVSAFYCWAMATK
ncbi:hypothetical protein ACFSL6_23155 [Paenibacillus thailandensis]|uniref:Cytochrome P450 n=1 Tax=Paenibacillus thailandensis TaxID=393250 RepID=A0ABW5QYF4_9BACL